MSREFTLETAQPSWSVASLARRWRVILAAVVVAAGVSLGLALAQPKEYLASADVLLRDQGGANVLGGNPFQPSIDTTRQASTNLALVSEPAVAAIAAERAGMTARKVFQSVVVDAKAQSDIITVDARANSPREAERLANAYARAIIEFRAQTDLHVLEEAEAATRNRLETMTQSEREGAEGSDLETRLQQLRYLQTIESGNAQVVQEATTALQVAPRPLRSGVLGGVFGLLCGIGLAFLLERFDRRLHESREAQRIFNEPVLVSIPQHDALAGRNGHAPLPAGVVEAFQILRETLKARVYSTELKTMLVTSALPGEGKSTVSWQLARAEAASGASVLLIEADLRRPVMADRHGLETSSWVADVARGSARLEDAIVTVPLGENGSAALYVLPAAPTPPGALAPEHLLNLVRDAAERFDLVVIDAASPLAVAETIALLPVVDGVLVVSRISRSTEAASRRLRQLLTDLHAEVVGIVVNAEDPEWSYSMTYSDNQPARRR